MLGGVIFETLQAVILIRETGLRVLPDQLPRPRIRCVKNVMYLRLRSVAKPSDWI